jgi:bifunctional non-homologous end joining protein LigD/DNA ligase-1
MLPKNFEPMLATLADPFDSSEYTYEIKWDGYRCLAFLDSHTRLLSRNQHDMTNIFPELGNLHLYTKKQGCLIDGEVIALRNGKPSFIELQKRAQLRNKEMIEFRRRQIPIIYVVFDLLFYNQIEVYNRPLNERRQLLYDNFKAKDELILASFIETKGQSYFKAISELGLEGVVAKKNGSVYHPGKRSKDWLKFKRKIHQNFIICGYLINTEKAESTLRSLILGAYIDNRLSFFGMVGNGFTEREMNLIGNELKKITTSTCPFSEKPNTPKNVFWVKPAVVCEVEYLERTDDGSLRHPIFKRFRPDLKTEDCQYEG